MDMAWYKSKAAEMIERELANIVKSSYPDDDFCNGLIQMAYALGLIDDNKLMKYTNSASIVVTARRRQLREAKIQDAIRRNT